MSPTAPRLAIEILNAARRWVQARAGLRRALDSKAAPPQAVEKAKAAYNKSAEELERLVTQLERTLQIEGTRVPNKRGQSSPFPWRELFGMVAAGAKAVESALEPAPLKTTVVPSKKVIDMEMEK
jgi:hypothetical protein